MLLYNRKEFTALLNREISQVTFRKANGEIRVMHCTLRQDLIEPTNNTGSTNTNDDRMIVWDVEKDAWRSFRLDSVSAVVTSSFDPRSKTSPSFKVAAPQATNASAPSFRDIILNPRVNSGPLAGDFR